MLDRRRAKHVRSTIEMKTYQSLNSDTGFGNGRSLISDLCVASKLDVKHLRFLALCIRHNPDLSVKFFVKKCVLYTRNNSNQIRFGIFSVM